MILFERKAATRIGRLLAAAPYFWQYLMSEARSRFDLDQPAMKAEAVRDVMEQVAKIQDRVEQLEVAKAVAEGFKVPENLILERLNLDGPKAGTEAGDAATAAPAGPPFDRRGKTADSSAAQDRRKR